MRSEFPAVLEQGLRLNHAQHGILSLNPVQAYVRAEDMPPCDWLLVGTKTTSNLQLAPAIVQAAAPGAKVLLLQNGLDVEDALRSALPDSLHLLGGLCFICVHRAGPGQIEHQALGAVNLGYHSGPAAVDPALTRAIVEEGAGLFREAGLDSQAMDNLHQARWQKLVWNVPYNGLSVLLRASTTALMADPDIRQLIQDLMQEVLQGLRLVAMSFRRPMPSSCSGLPSTCPITGRACTMIFCIGAPGTAGNLCCTTGCGTGRWLRVAQDPGAVPGPGFHRPVSFLSPVHHPQEDGAWPRAWMASWW